MLRDRCKRVLALLPSPKGLHPCARLYRGLLYVWGLPLHRGVPGHQHPVLPLSCYIPPQHPCHLPSPLEPDRWATSQNCESVKRKFTGKGHGAPLVTSQETQQAPRGARE